MRRPSACAAHRQQREIGAGFGPLDRGGAGGASMIRRWVANTNATKSHRPDYNGAKQVI
jgi:hypothetical protein